MLDKTSIASFLDLEDLPVYHKGVKYRFSGKRVRKRLYIASNGLKYNADVNGNLTYYEKHSQTLLVMG